MTQWEGSKVNQKRLQTLLGLRPQEQDRIESTLMKFKDKLKVAVMKRRLMQKQCFGKWIYQRLKGTIKLRQLKAKKIERAL